MEFDYAHPLSTTFEGEIDVTRVWTGEDDRDGHLRTADFFDVEQHPTMAFRGRISERTGDSHYKALAELTLRGVTREVALDVAYLGQWETPFWEGEESRGTLRWIGFEATGFIDRHDFGVSWQDELPGGGVVVSNEIAITLDVEADRRRGSREHGRDQLLPRVVGGA